MTLRLQRGEVKALAEATGDLRLQRGEVKALAASSGTLRLQRGEVKVLVRTTPRQTIALAVPPAHTTHSRAPFIRSSSRQD